MNKLLYGLMAASLSITVTGCAVTSGMNAGKLPKADEPSAFTATNGMAFNVTALTVNNIPQPKLTTALKKPISLPPLTSFTGSEYRIATGDIIDIYLPGYPEITPVVTSTSNNAFANGYLVDQGGFLQFPMIGRVKAAGLTPTQLTNSLASKLARYVRQPDPQVKVLSYRGNKFYIDGQVKNPGQFIIADQPVSIYSAISMAGGPASTADMENITLMRGGQSYHLGFKSMETLGYSPSKLMIRNGDVIQIGNITQNKVMVMGEVMKPSTVIIPEDGISLASVIGEVSGLDSPPANARKVYVLREDLSQQTADIYHIDLTTITNLSVANRFKMQPGDIVYVDPTGLVRWSRVISMLLPVSSISATANQF